MAVGGEGDYIPIAGCTDGLKQEGRCVQPCSRVIVPCDLWPFLGLLAGGFRSVMWNTAS